MKSVWRQIWILTFASLAEPAPAAPAPAPADEGATDDEPPIGAPVKPKEELPPDLRQSADNNVSFPVDI